MRRFAQLCLFVALVTPFIGAVAWRVTRPKSPPAANASDAKATRPRRASTPPARRSKAPTARQQTVVDEPDPAWTPARKSGRWTSVVIHHSATTVGGADRFDEAHRAKGWDGLGYHFVIGNGSDTADGEVEAGPRWRRQAHGAHCKTRTEYFNRHGIGICLVGNFEEDPPSPGQMRSLRRLVGFLCDEFDIPPSRVYTHGGITGETRCPGRLFDLKAFRQELQRRGG